MLRKKSIYRKELNSYMYVSQLCAKLNKVDVLYIWCRVSITSQLAQVFASSILV